MSEHHHSGMTKHRIDALTDGIFAVAMTLLIIEIKIPEAAHPASNAALVDSLVHLMPKFVGWVVSFFVLGFFWWAHHRAFAYVRTVDGKLIALNILFLGFVTLMPFASAMTGEYPRFIAGQIFYVSNMLMLAVCSQLMWRYIHRHPALCGGPMPTSALAAARARNTLLIFACAVSIAIAILLPTAPVAGNMAFSLMALSGVVSRRAEAKAQALEESTSLSV